MTNPTLNTSMTSSDLRLMFPLIEDEVETEDHVPTYPIHDHYVYQDYEWIKSITTDPAFVLLFSSCGFTIDEKLKENRCSLLLEIYKFVTDQNRLNKIVEDDEDSIMYNVTDKDWLRDFLLALQKKQSNT